MKVYAAIALLLLFFSVSLDAQAGINTIIPKPVSAVTLEGIFTIHNQTALITDTPLSINASHYLQHQLFLNAGFMLTVKEGAHRNGLHYQINTQLENEAYRLHITPEKIHIEAGTPSGFFYATVTLMQLMDPAIWSQQKADIPKKQWALPACIIEDAPRFRWRGMMLDSARNFFSVEYVKKFIDRMAQHKLNVFHWHLTDDEGWRIEIKKYPRLTEIGGERGPKTALPFSFFPAMRGPKDARQQGFYTQDQISEIVTYAQKRSVHVLPEIDTPAHAKAAVVAYPDLLQDPHDTSVYTSIQKIRTNTMDAGRESTYRFLDDVIAELSALFPFEYIHLGGDEVPKGAWTGSPSVAGLMTQKKFKSIGEVHAYFFTRMENTLAKYHRKMIVWQEVNMHNAMLNDNTVIMAWRGNGAGTKVAQAHRNVIMAPAQYLYFDQQYLKDKSEYGHTWAGPTDTEDAYSFNPTSALSGSDTAYIMGVHGCLWSETALNEDIADYLVWPRLFALAEMGWSVQDDRHWDEFKTRAFDQGLKRLENQNVRYRLPNALREQ